jgi:hypothetical protein
VLERSPIQRAGSSGRGVVVGNKLAGIDSATLRLTPFDGEEGSSGELQRLSTSVADILHDGRILFRAQNELGSGQDYSPSVSILEATPTGHTGIAMTMPAMRSTSSPESLLDFGPIE